MEIRREVMDEVAQAAFLEKLDALFCRDLADYREIASGERLEFMSAAIALAGTKGFKTEQGIASYALALWYLGGGFEERSEALASLLKGPYHEVRRIHAMNCWVDCVTADPDNIEAADEAIKESLKLTAPWGNG